MKKIKAGIIGGAGYTGGEAIRILLNHPDVELTYVQSTSNAGNPLWSVYTDLLGDTDIKFTDKYSPDVDVIFICAGHDAARRFIEENDIPGGMKIVDLSQDFRLRDKSEIKGRKFIYGLPECNRDSIKNADSIANPGCFATCLQLGMLPLAANGLLKGDVHVTATTGSTGAGQALSATTHFTWRANNMSVYKAFGHQHLNEIGETIKTLQNNFCNEINFIPYRGDFTRGIIASIYTDCDKTEEEIKSIYNNYYKTAAFTHVSSKNINLKQVVNTNKCLVYIEKHEEKVMIISIIDNLLKGASGQAVQNMNLMFGLDEMAGLRLKATAF